LRFYADSQRVSRFFAREHSRELTSKLDVNDESRCRFDLDTVIDIHFDHHNAAADDVHDGDTDNPAGSAIGRTSVT
jgi:hypothetical protein